jgi:hypothetical protein
MKPALVILMVAGLAAASLSATPRSPANAPHRVQVMTRQVLAFSQREQALADALGKSDHAATDRLLSADFEMRDGATAVQPVPRALWISSRSSGMPEQMAVHDYGDVAVVSFVNNVTGSKAKSAAFVVDIWQKHGEDWQLAVRYQSQLDARSAPAGDIRPTGKN